MSVQHPTPPSIQSYPHILLCTHLSQTFYITPEEMKDSAQGSTPQIQIISAVSASRLSPLISNTCLIIPHTQVLIPLCLTWLPREILCMCSYSQVCCFASHLLVNVGKPSAPCKAYIPLLTKKYYSLWRTCGGWASSSRPTVRHRFTGFSYAITHFLECCISAQVKADCFVSEFPNDAFSRMRHNGYSSCALLCFTMRQESNVWTWWVVSH